MVVLKFQKHVTKYICFSTVQNEYYYLSDYNDLYHASYPHQEKKKKRKREKNCCKGKLFDTLHKILLLFLSLVPEGQLNLRNTNLYVRPIA